jgi:hypothetical protein
MQKWGFTIFAYVVKLQNCVYNTEMKVILARLNWLFLNFVGSLLILTLITLHLNAVFVCYH